MLGLNRKSVELAAHRKEWKALYEQEEKLLRRAFGELLMGVEHIGSTAIAQIVAKPIIDIMVGVRDLAEVESRLSPLAAIGYEYRGESGIVGRRYFRKGTPAVSTHHLSATEYGGNLWRKHLLFRDYLREHREAAGRYDELKKELATKFKNNREAYTDAKTEFVEEILRAANFTEVP